MNIKKHLKIKDMAVRNAAGIKARRERDIENEKNVVENRCEELVNTIQEDICGGESTNKIEELIDMFDTMNVIIEEGYDIELDDFLARYEFLKFYPEENSILQEGHVANIEFTLPKDVEGDFADMKIKLKTYVYSAELYGIGAPWIEEVKPIIEDMNNKSYPLLLEEVRKFGNTLNTLIDDFFAWVDKNFPEQA